MSERDYRLIDRDLDLLTSEYGKSVTEVILAEANAESAALAAVVLAEEQADY